MGTIPIVTIVGVPNTGKSTLFNRILGQRKSLIHSIPGMTRDILRGRAEYDGRLFYINDSGGFFPGKDELAQEINRRIFREVEHSDVVIFLFDGRRDILGYERDFYFKVKKMKTMVLGVVNKVDNPETFILPDTYYSLKTDLELISAEHNRRIEELLERIKMLVNMPLAESYPQETSPRITIVGKPNVGKSSIVNRLLNDEWVIVSPKPGTTRDSIDLEIRRNQQKFILIDNAGIRKLQKVKEGTESAAVIRAEKFMKDADIIVFVLDMSRPIDQNDFLIAKKIVKSAKPVIIAGNKWDLIPQEKKGTNITGMIHSQFHQLYFAPFIAVSAKTGKNVFSLIDLSEAIFQRLKKKIKTRELNEIIQPILKTKRFFLINRRVFNPKYVSIESYKPFFIVFHGHAPGRLQDADEIFLKKKIGKELGLEGIPVFFKVSN